MKHKKEILIEWINAINNENAIDLLIDIINNDISKYQIINKYLKLKYDSAIPQNLYNTLDDMGLNNNRPFIFDYTNKKFGELKNIYEEIIIYIIQTFELDNLKLYENEKII